MIPVQGVEGRTVAVLGLGRSGLTAARALRAGGAEVLAWDDGLPAREAAEAEGFATAVLDHVDQQARRGGARRSAPSAPAGGRPRSRHGARPP